MSKKTKYLIVVIILVGPIFTSCRESGKGDTNMKQADATNLEKLEKKLQDYINSKDEMVAIAFQDVKQKFYLGINDTFSMHAASTMKVPVMMEVYHQSEAGKFLLDDSLIIRNEFKSIIDGSSYSLDINEDGGDRLYSMIGSKESIRSLVIEMITYSGNLATNLLIDLVEAKNVQKFMESLGAQHIQILRGVEDIKAYRAGKSNTTTAKDLAIIYQVLFDGTFWTAQSREEMIDILLDQHYRKKIPAKLPSEVQVAHKTGSITRIDHDSGIIFPKEHVPYILVVLTKGFEDHTIAQETIADLSRIIYDWYITR